MFLFLSSYLNSWASHIFTNKNTDQANNYSINLGGYSVFCLKRCLIFRNWQVVIFINTNTQLIDVWIELPSTCSKYERNQWHRSSAFTVLLTLNRFRIIASYCCCWRCTSKCRLAHQWEYCKYGIFTYNYCKQLHTVTRVKTILINIVCFDYMAWKTKFSNTFFSEEITFFQVFTAMF